MARFEIIHGQHRLLFERSPGDGIIQVPCYQIAVSLDGKEQTNAVAASEEEGWVDRLKADPVYTASRIPVYLLGDSGEPIVERVTGDVAILVSGWMQRYIDELYGGPPAPPFHGLASARPLAMSGYVDPRETIVTAFTPAGDQQFRLNVAFDPDGNVPRAEDAGCIAREGEQSRAPRPGHRCSHCMMTQREARGEWMHFRFRHGILQVLCSSCKMAEDEQDG